MIRVLAIDPGNKESGYAVIDEKYKPINFGKVDNDEFIVGLPDLLREYGVTEVVIEMIGHYGTGLPAGKTVFDTCVWIGRFSQQIFNSGIGDPHIVYVLRKHYVAELTGSAKAKDANIIQYLVDRFAPDEPNRGKGTKQSKGWFYGFKADVWQAYSLAVYHMDSIKGV